MQERVVLHHKHAAADLTVVVLPLPSRPSVEHRPLAAAAAAAAAVIPSFNTAEFSSSAHQKVFAIFLTG